MFTCAASYYLSFWRRRLPMLSVVSPESNGHFSFPVAMAALEKAIVRLRQNDPNLVELE